MPYYLFLQNKRTDSLAM